MRRSTTWLAERRVENPRLDAEILLGHALGLDRLQLYLSFDRPLDDAERDRIRALIRERGRHVPVAYLTGEREFYSLSFHVEPGVLIPRPETEHLVEVVLAELDGREASLFADVGTGSGCIAVTLLHELQTSRGHAVDVSAKALDVTRANATRHGVLERLTLHQGDLLEPLQHHPDFGRLDVVASNPPYVHPHDATVEEGVRLHEPPEAVFVPGDDPLAVLRRLAETSRPALRAGGLLALEVGAGQAGAVSALLAALGYGEVSVTPDLAKIDRVVAGRLG